MTTSAPASRASPISGCSRRAYLKIDIEFVRDLTQNETNQHLVRSIIHLARGLNKQTIAEGVENEEALALLRSFGVDYAQGFHLGRPEPVDAAPANSQTVSHAIARHADDIALLEPVRRRIAYSPGSAGGRSRWMSH